MTLQPKASQCVPVCVCVSLCELNPVPTPCSSNHSSQLGVWSDTCKHTIRHTHNPTLGKTSHFLQALCLWLTFRAHLVEIHGQKLLREKNVCINKRHYCGCCTVTLCQWYLPSTHTVTLTHSGTKNIFTFFSGKQCSCLNICILYLE